MTAHALGEFTLSLSTIVYFLWFVPQILLNFKRKSTDGLSFWMHGLLLIGYSADLLYGFGRDMQWQYRMVTVVGLIFLFIQHAQFAQYGLHTRAQKNSFILLSVFIVILLVYAIINFTLLHHDKQYYDIAGFMSDLCWMTYLFPQIIKNYLRKSTVGLSVWFVIIDIALSFLDIISTFTLHWDWPSMLGVCVDVVKKSILLFQIVYYRKRKAMRNAL